MQTLILPFSETDTYILNFINRLRRQNKAVEIKDSLETHAVRAQLIAEYKNG
ncbi:MAG: hypothetical protein U5L45_26230 [Saprospiraceae bacterium]|nr:hypothetical protein [Saprospiraceae bacterium]